MEIDPMAMDNNKPTISGIMTVKNVLSLGYPYLEAIISALPIVDEFLISDGGSTDKTFYHINKLKEKFPQIQIFETPVVASPHWESFDEALNFLIAKAKGEWLLEVQSDEFRHEKDIPQLIEIIKLADAEGYNSLRQPCIYYMWTKRDSYVYRNIRILRKIPKLISCWGGDDFQVGIEREPREGFTSHNVPPELDVDIEIIHMSRAFPQNRVSQDESNVKNMGTEGKTRLETYERTKQRDWSRILPPKKEEVLDCLPAIMKGLSQDLKYRVREELFDNEWLREVTGLNYE